MHFRRDHERPTDWTLCSLGNDWAILYLKEIKDTVDIARALMHFDVSCHSRYGFHREFGGTESKDECKGVVDADVGVN
jgi:hypothetical protein